MTRQPAIEVVGAVIVSGRRCLVAKRGPGGSAAFKWEFPGGKVKRGESAAEALKREIYEELELRIDVTAAIGSVRAAASAGLIELTLYSARLISGSPVLREHLEVRWVEADDLHDMDFAAADRPLLGRVEALVRGAEPA